MAVFLQISVFIQPLLPERLQTALVCETISTALSSPTVHHTHHLKNKTHAHKKLEHECFYCHVYSHTFIQFSRIKEIFIRLKVKLLAFEQAFRHIYFVLQRLFLLPQGRAPPNLYIT